MAFVCAADFPKGTRRYQHEDGYYMDDKLKANLDVLIKNIVDDWDFTIIISGHGDVRVGKSVIGQQVGYYITSEIKRLYNKVIPFTLETNYSFNGKEHISKGNYLGVNFPNSTLIFDEAGSDLQTTKVMERTQKELTDFFRECGQYNLFHILIVPDFFTLPKGIAVTRSICLIDVYHGFNSDGKFVRGNFNFYSKPNKKFLYNEGRKYQDYSAARKDFDGKFTNFYPLNEQDYRALKKQALLSREDNRNERINRFRIQRDLLIYALHKELKLDGVKLMILLRDKYDFDMKDRQIQLAIQRNEEKRLAESEQYTNVTEKDTKILPSGNSSISSKEDDVNDS